MIKDDLENGLIESKNKLLKNFGKCHLIMNSLNTQNFLIEDLEFLINRYVTKYTINQLLIYKKLIV